MLLINASHCDASHCNASIWGSMLKNYKKLNDVLRRYNGLTTRYQKEKSKDNLEMLKEAFADLREAANEVLDD